MQMTLSEGHISELILAKNYAEAFDGIVKLYGERMYWQIRRYVLSHDDADDVLQECWAKIWKNLPMFKSKSGVYTWIYRIVVNTSLNFLRKRSLMTRFAYGDEALKAADRLESDVYFNGDALQAALYKAIANLPPKQRVVFEMRYFDELDYRTISQLLNTSEGALKASYHFASEKVRAEMKKLQEGN
ncbi:MAG: RNA polymerase sigma factor [Candidatus Cryptobacteroides sp.]